MKAIVLSCDKYHPFSQHMVQCYDALWPGHPFTFLIPYTQDLPTDWDTKSALSFIQTPNDIKGCALKLLESCDEDEWVYWCIDDKYPIYIDVDVIEKTFSYIDSDASSEISAVCISRSRGLMLGALVDENDRIDIAPSLSAIRRLRFNQIWYHQFIRAGVLKYMFQSFPDDDFRAKEMDYFIHGLDMPAHFGLYVTEENNSLYGESTTRGKITANCAKSFKAKGLALPQGFPLAAENQLMGQAPFWPRDFAKKLLKTIGLR